MTAARLPSGIETKLLEWDRAEPLRLLYGNTGTKLARNAATVREAIARLGLPYTARAEGSSQSVVVETVAPEQG